MKAPASAGILFSHLEWVLEEYSSSAFTAADLCNALLETKLNDPNSGSYADYLMSNAETQHYVKDTADYFVSYVWVIDLHDTFAALRSKFKDQEVYVWMDFVVVDQHQGTKRVLDFEYLEEVFAGNLQTIGKAMVVMIPAMNPMAATRSWCCFEWYTLVHQNIAFDYCVTPQDEHDFIARVLARGLDNNTLQHIFSSVNVTNASAREMSDQQAIQGLISKVGPGKVNDVVMLSMKSIQIRLIEQALEQANTLQESFNALFSQADLWAVLGEYDKSMSSLQLALQIPEIDNNLRVLVQQRIGSVHLANAQYDTALAMFLETLKRNIALYGPTTAQVAESHCLIGAACARLGKFPLALQHYTSSLDIETMLYEPEKPHTNMASTLNGIANTHYSMGNFNLAISTYEQSLRILQANLKSQHHMEYAPTLANLANVHRRCGQVELALELYLQVEQIERMALGATHDRVAATKLNIAKSLADVGRFDEALKETQHALEILLLRFGENHETVALAYRNLGVSYSRLDRKEESMQAYMKSLALTRRLLGNDHLAVAGILGNIAGAHYKQGKLQSARSTYLQAIDILTKTLGGEHVDVAEQLTNVGNVLNDMQLYSEAKENFIRALEIQRKAFADSQITRTLMGMGSANLGLNKLDEAIAYWNKALAVYGNDNLDYADACAMIAQELSDCTHNEQALFYLEKCLQAQEQCLGANNLEVGQTLHWMGVTLLAMQSHQAAAQRLNRAVYVFEQCLPQCKDQLDDAKAALNEAKNGPLKQKHKCAVS